MVWQDPEELQSLSECSNPSDFISPYLLSTLHFIVSTTPFKA